MNPRDLSPGELLRATREQGFKWWIERGALAVMKPVVKGKKRCHVDRLWREVCGTGPLRGGDVMKKSCKTCVHARWHLTQTGRIASSGRHLCVFPLPVVMLPSSITEYYGFPLKYHRMCIQPDMGQDCPCHERTAEKPKQVGREDWAMQ